MITLDANNPAQVDGGDMVIDVNLDDARRMIIFSGTAIPNHQVNDDDHDYPNSVTVNLRRTVLAIEQATVSVGLASFGNDDTTFRFDTNSARLDVDPISQELLLRVEISARGEGTGLYRFGYQVVTVVTTQATGISGTIMWDRSLFDAKGFTSGEVAQLFKIAANRVERITPPEGFVYDQYTPVAYGVTTGISQSKDEFLASYEIPGAPYNQPLFVTVEVGALFASPSIVNATVATTQIAGPRPAVLTIVHLGVTGEDFQVTASQLK